MGTNFKTHPEVKSAPVRGIQRVKKMDQISFRQIEAIVSKVQIQYSQRFSNLYLSFVNVFTIPPMKCHTAAHDVEGGTLLAEAAVEDLEPV